MDSKLIESYGMNVFSLPKLYRAVEMATCYYHELLTSIKDNIALEYLEGRGISSTTLTTFRLGYAPKATGVLQEHLLKRGFTQNELLLAGLVTEPSMYDIFRNRLIFPISEHSGRIVGFGARTLDNSEPKYINSPLSTIFHKSYLLYGLHQAKDTIKNCGQVIIVEGYTDVLTAHQYDFKNIVASMGTAISEYQIELLRPLASEIVIAFDGDAGGEAASLKFANRYLRGDYDEGSIGEVAKQVPDSF